MEEKKTYYKEDLIEGAIEDLQERIDWCEKEEEIYDEDDLISEIADNNIPIYTYDLLQYASNNFDLIQPNDLAGDNPDVIKIIQCNIYEMLTEHLYNHINNKVEVKEIK
tara:strand:+ start:308 stop:634 length:327 start_codon:yes stop_codon:yes gene_type:complete